MVNKLYNIINKTKIKISNLFSKKQVEEVIEEIKEETLIENTDSDIYLSIFDIDSEILKESNKIYGWFTLGEENIVKVGEARENSSAYKRVYEDEVKTHDMYEKRKIVFVENRTDKNSKTITDHDVHTKLKSMDIIKLKSSKGNITEQFECTLEQLRHAYDLCYKNLSYIPKREELFDMRDEQILAIKKTYDYFINNPGKKLEFLWNAKPRFGKCFASYQLALKMKWERVLVITFKPAVEDEWKNGLLTHRDFKGWEQFITKDNKYEDIDQNKPYVCFRSLQDLLGIDSDGNIKTKNEWIHDIKWDCIIIDECHYGAHREKTKKLLRENNVENENFGYDEEEEEIIKQAKENQEEDHIKDENDIFDEINESIKNNIKSNFRLHLSGTPYKILARGTFIEEQIFNWTYIDEQRLKKEENKNLEMPNMNLLIYRLPNNIISQFENHNKNSFNFKEWFSVNNDGEFKNFRNINDFLNLISRDKKLSSGLRGVEERNRENESNLYYLFDEVENKIILKHTLWYMPGKKECKALAILLKNHQIFKHYEIIVATGDEINCGKKGADEVRRKINTAVKNNKKTITLSCGMLTTGVTIPEWDAVLMLRNVKSPELYFQTAFRAQSPRYKNGKEIDKKECYIIDFAPERALVMYEYLYNKSYQESSLNKNMRETLKEYINYLAILICDEAILKNIDIEDILNLFNSFNSSKSISSDKEIFNKEEISYIFNNDNEILRILNKIQISEKIDKKNQNASVINSNGMSTPEYKKENNMKKSKNNISKEFLANEEVAVKKLKTLALKIPEFIFLANEKISSLKELLDCNEHTLFESTFKITSEEFKYLFEKKCFNNFEVGYKINQYCNDFKSIKIYI